MAYEFNSEVDKITERELVFDILDRLSLGRNVMSEDGTSVYINKGSKLTDVLRNIIDLNIDDSDKEYYKDLKVVTLKIPMGERSVLISVEGLKYRKILKAISKQTGIDYIDCLSTYMSNNNIFTIVFTSDTVFTHDDELKLYLI